MTDAPALVQEIDRRLDALEKHQDTVTQAFRMLEKEIDTLYGMQSLSPLFAAIADKLEP